MKLHGRYTKPDFWSDMALKRILGKNPLWRLIYQGLWAVADDSGCLELDLEEIQILLFAGESITVEELSQCCEALIAGKKALPYMADGKFCLYLTNFARHQPLHNPGKPVVPLPEWLTFNSDDNRYRGGKYELNVQLLDEKLGQTQPAVTEAAQRCDSTYGTLPDRNVSGDDIFQDLFDTITPVQDGVKSGRKPNPSGTSSGEPKGCPYCRKPMTATDGPNFLIQQFHDRYRKQFNTCPTINHGKHAGIFKGLLKTHDEATILMVMDRYLDCGDAWIQGKGYSIEIMSQSSTFDGLRMSCSQNGRNGRGVDQVERAREMARRICDEEQ